MIEPNSKVMDLGCGDGVLLNELINYKKISGLGIEISIERIKKCFEHGVSVIQEDLEEGLKNFQDHSFDYVILSQTLDEITNPVYLIQEMLRVGDKCIISFENISYWKNRISFLFKGAIEGNSQLNMLRNGQKKQIITINKFLNFCMKYSIKICNKIYLPNRNFKLTYAFPNFLCRTAIFILKGREQKLIYHI